jgi:4-hydroxy-tetrahydrodipicolinate synthase
VAQAQTVSFRLISSLGPRASGRNLYTVVENHPIRRKVSRSVKRVAGSGVDKVPIKRPIFSGCFTALITPLRGGKVDEKAFQALVDWQVREGIAGLVPCGTTGESPTLSHKEHMRVTELCVEVAARRVPVIAGTGSNSTQETIDFARHAEKAGADAQLVVTPYYNKPTQEGLYQHFKAVHDQSGLPIIIYNIPGRSVVDMSVETMVRLAKLPRIVGVKDATGDLSRPLYTRLAVGPDFSLLSGEDVTALAFLAQGGHGFISVTSNIAPKICAAMEAAWRSGEVREAQRINEILAPLNRALFLETSPSPVKYAASLLGLSTAEVRLPLCEITDNTKFRVRDAMAGVGLVQIENQTND